MTEATFTVQGMTCGHCVSSVTEEVSKIEGVQEVDVDLGTGQVRVASALPVTVDALAGAVREAGYELSS